MQLPAGLSPSYRTTVTVVVTLSSDRLSTPTVRPTTGCDTVWGECIRPQHPRFKVSTPVASSRAPAVPLNRQKTLWQCLAVTRGSTCSVSCSCVLRTRCDSCSEQNPSTRMRSGCRVSTSDADVIRHTRCLRILSCPSWPVSHEAESATLGKGSCASSLGT